MGLTRRHLLASAGTLALSGCLGILDGGSNGADLDGPVATARLPDDPSASTYAAMGAPDAPRVRYFGNWKCPYCAKFSAQFLPELVTDYVEPGDVSLTFRGLAYAGGRPFLGPDAPRATRAGLAVWNLDPDSYWAFHEYVMANQPPESEEWATTEKLVSFAKEAGVGPVAELRTSIESGDHESAVRETSRAASDAGVRSTPTLVVDGTTVNALDREKVRSLLDDLVDGS